MTDPKEVKECEDCRWVTYREGFEMCAFASSFTSTMLKRSKGEPCGPEGKLFERKDSPHVR